MHLPRHPAVNVMIPHGELLNLFEVHAIVRKRKIEQQMKKRLI
jgi:hypothetical protein